MHGGPAGFVRRRWVTGAAAALIALVATGTLFLRGTTTPVPVADVVERYRERAVASAAPRPSGVSAPPRATGSAPPVATERPAAGSTAPRTQAGPSIDPLPEEGVYVYDTEGGESVDVFGGTGHTYPDTTTITVTHTDCGMIERWDALEERWDERETCRSVEGDRLVRTTSYHRFFSQSDERTSRCEGLTSPAGAEPGDRWTTRCYGDEGTSRSDATAVAFEDIDVDGTAVRTLHVRVVTVVEGASEGQTGRSEREVWGSTTTGLVVRERARVDTTGREPVVGEVHYQESYEITLRSLEPRR